jgi:hypothetical protein
MWFFCHFWWDEKRRPKAKNEILQNGNTAGVSGVFCGRFGAGSIAREAVPKGFV